jgi:hypothetical protein
LGAKDDSRWVAWHEVNEEERNERDSQQDRYRLKDAPENVGGHGSLDEPVAVPAR